MQKGEAGPRQAAFLTHPTGRGIGALDPIRDLSPVCSEGAWDTEQVRMQTGEGTDESRVAWRWGQCGGKRRQAAWEGSRWHWCFCALTERAVR